MTGDSNSRPLEPLRADRTRAVLRRTAALCICLCVAQASPAAAQATFTVHGAGFPSDLSEDGSTVVGQDLAAGPFVWTAASGQVSIGGYSASAVSDDGQVIAGSVPYALYAEPAIWTPSTGWVDIGPFPWMTQPSAGQAYAVSGDGTHVVGQAHDGMTGYVPFVWTAQGGLEVLGGIPGQPNGNGFAIDVSDDGQWILGVVGGEFVRWDGQRVAHALPSGSAGQGPMTSVHSLSAGGDRVTAGGVSIGGVIWDRTAGLTELEGPGSCCVGGLPFVEMLGWLEDLDDAGSVGVGTWIWAPTLFGIATTGTIWTPAGGVRPLSDELTRLGASLGGFNVRHAAALALNGRLVVGGGVRAGSSTSEWFLATLPLEVGSRTCVPAAPNSTGASASLVGSGSARLADNDLGLVAFGLPADSFGFALSATSLTAGTVPPLSHGRLCLGGPIGRHLDTVRNAGTAGTLTIPVDLGLLPHPSLGATAAQIGETWHFQVWYRDANPLPASNFTGAVSIVIE